MTDVDDPSLQDRPRGVTPVANAGAPRAERDHVEFPDISWTAFDRYARYGALARAITANLGPGRHHALDVGDNSGYLRAFAPDLDVVSVDREGNDRPLEGTRLVRGDGARLPFPDASFDVVVSCDALEHVPPVHRSGFLQELIRCTRDMVVVAAPFDTPGVAGSEELVRRFVGAVTGAPQPQLGEHAEHGLPSLDSTERTIEAAGMRVVSLGNGNLQDWVLGMFVKHQVVGRGGFLDLDIGFDVFYNMALQDRSQVGPYYRHLVIGRRSSEPLTGAPPIPPGPTLDAASLLGAILTSAPGSTGALTALAAVQEQQAEAFGHLMARLEGVEAALQHLMQRFDGTDGALDLLLSRGDSAGPVNKSGGLSGLRRRLRRGDDRP